MPARKIPKRHGIKNPKKMTRWEKQRVSREIARKGQRKEKARKLIARGQRAREALRKAGKKPLIEPLTMSEQGIVKGNLVLKDGQRKVVVPLIVQGAAQGVYRLGKHIIVARSRTGKAIYPGSLKLYELKKGHEIQLGDYFNNAFFEIPRGTADLGHMYLPKELRYTGLAGRHASRADRHYRQQRQGKNTFWMSKYRQELFDGILKKTGYKREKVEEHDLWIYRKEGKVKKTANMEKFHLIEAIDPKTGKKREYAFPIERKK